MSDRPTSAGDGVRPTRGRLTLLYLTLALSVITFLDRVAISSAAPVIRDELGLSLVEMAWTFSVFTFAYAAFEIPSGWLGDVIGPRKALARIVIWWSAFTMVTGLAWNLTSLLVARALFGVGEAGAFPNISRSFATWIPETERGRAHGLVLMGTRAGGAVTPIVMVALMAWLGWRWTFAFLGVIGVLWVIVWLRWFTDNPAAHPSVNAAELAHIQAGLGRQPGRPFRWRLLLSGNLALLCLMYFSIGYTLYFNLTWLPLYLREARGFTVGQAGLISSIVLAAGAVGTWLGGRITDRLVARHGLRVGRSIGAVALPVAGLLVVGAALAPNPIAAAILLTLTLGVGDLAMGASWSMCHDLGGSRAGVVAGAMNTMGNIGGAISPLVVGYAVQWWNSWTLPFFVTAGVYVAGGLLTLLIRSAALNLGGTGGKVTRQTSNCELQTSNLGSIPMSSPSSEFWRQLKPIANVFREGAAPEVYTPEAPEADDRWYVPLTETVFTRPLLIVPSQNRWCDVLMAKGAGLVNRHYHPHAVYAYTISGKWSYLEHDWVATAGDFVYESPGEAHTLVAHESGEPMRVHFNVTGPLIWLDEQGQPAGTFDVFDYIKLCKDHYEKVGIGAAAIDRIIR